MIATKFKVTEISSKDLKALGFLCSLMVIWIHCWSPSSYFCGESDFSTIQAGLAFGLTCSFARCAVPIFFIVSGFFLALDYRRNQVCAPNEIFRWYIRVLKKKFVSLYVPFVIWNALNVVLSIGMGGANGCAWGEWRTIIGKIFGFNPYIRLGCMQFWFVQTLIYWIIASPVVFWTLRNRWFSFAAIAVIMGLWIVNPCYLPQAIAFESFLWLLVGSVVALHIFDPSHPLKIPKMTNLFVLIAFVGSVSARVYGGVMRDMTIYWDADLVVIVSGIALAFINLKKIGGMFESCKGVWGLSFWVFAFHTLALTALGLLSAKIGMAAFPLYMLKVSCGIGLTLVVGWGARRLFPRVFNVLTGGRS